MRLGGHLKLSLGLGIRYVRVYEGALCAVAIRTPERMLRDSQVVMLLEVFFIVLGVAGGLVGIRQGATSQLRSVRVQTNFWIVRMPRVAFYIREFEPSGFSRKLLHEDSRDV